MFYNRIPRNLSASLFVFLLVVFAGLPCFAYADDGADGPDEAFASKSQELLSEYDADNALSNPNKREAEEMGLELTGDDVEEGKLEETIVGEERFGADDGNEGESAQLIDGLMTEDDEETASVGSIVRETETVEPLLSVGSETPALQSSETEANEKATALAKANAASCPTASLKYMVHVQNIGNQEWKASPQVAGTTGRSLRLEALRVKLTGEAAGSVQYMVHVQNVGWQDARADGAEVGTHGQSLRLEAVRLALTGEVSEWYDIWYNVHVQNIGWQGWVKNGDLAGTVGKGLRLEAIEIRLDEKKAQSPGAEGLLGVRYRAHVQDMGWQSWERQGAQRGTTGESLRLEGLQITMDKGRYEGNIEYRVHVQNIGWQPWVGANQLAGTTGRSLRIEALQIKLTGSIANDYDVVYRAHVENVGWQRRVRNGETAGTEGRSLRVEAIWIDLVNKRDKTGWVGSGTNWSWYQNGAVSRNRWLDTDEDPIEDPGVHRYWLDANGKLAVSRAIDPTSASDKMAQYAAYATKTGAILKGKMTALGGVVLADKNGRAETAQGWLVTDKYDGHLERYWLEKKGAISVAKTGFFTVAGSKYYGYPNQGYVMRNVDRWVGDGWYYANNDGKLTSTMNKRAEHIENYIQWALRIAWDDSHGYSQLNRWGPDYDCSSLVVSALKNTGFRVGNASWTGNMLEELTKLGFSWHSGLSGLSRGDILLAHNSRLRHTEIFLGSNQMVGAWVSETGGISGVQGDQTGNEIRQTTFMPRLSWDGYLRYVE